MGHKKNSTASSTVSDEPLTVGTTVRVKGQKSTFMIAEGPNRKKEFLIVGHSIRIWVDEALISRATPIEEDTKGSTKQKRKKKGDSTYRSELLGDDMHGITLDLHGKTAAEAKELLEIQLDRALREDYSYIEVIHGFGSGVIKKTVQEFAESTRHVKRSEVSLRNGGVTRLYL